MRLKIMDIATHRNGISGEPFDVVLFHDGTSKKVGVVFYAPFHCAVLDITMLSVGNITFGINSWRGDQYEPYLRKAAARDRAYGEVFFIDCK